ncbi:VPS10 domain-containing receptor SorCS1 [Liparis tanakae]|uniref:VPS10 domain-containing receptor SorCS1 n=1 Tax=Liparis tanakae TaxID=230148 RepID=A0A4Z2IV12_9TELE|nr:VPS10 domain-containing receptor SorCS1 [Liparis tanakae]
MLTKYYDFNSGRVTESSLWRSTDYGTTYEKLNEKVGPKTILSYLYVSPNNKRKIMLLTDPEVESSLLISLDEGATYQKHSLAFDILSLLFHPEQEDWILAYSHDQKLYVSVEFGKRWQLVHDGVIPNRFYWSRMGLDKEQGMIHLEISVSDGRSQYITCKLQNCSDGNKAKPFPGFIIPNSLVVQDEYVFIQVPVGGQSVHYVSYKRNAFYPMKLPKYTLPKDLQIISTDDNQVVAAIQDWHQNDSYNLYMSESRGLFFTLMLENAVSSGGPEGNIMIDLYEVGSDENPYTSGNIVSKDSAPGVIIASGVVGPELTSNNVSIFITSDAGNSWREVQLSFDEGRNWDKYSFTSSPLYVDGVLGEPGEDTLIMT